MKPAVLLLLATAAGAQDLPAVGRISYGPALPPGGAICTGTLVAPDLVLTAGHCLRGNVENPAMVRFDAGLRGGTAVAAGQGAQVILAQGTGLPADVALLRLAEALPVEPLPLGPETDPWLTRIAYRRDAPGAPESDPMCLRLGEQDAMVHLMCGAVSGHSGAPLLSRGPDGGWRVAAVMVATLGGFGSVAVRIPPDLASEIPQAEGGSPDAP